MRNLESTSCAPFYQQESDEKGQRSPVSFRDRARLWSGREINIPLPFRLAEIWSLSGRFERQPLGSWPLPQLFLVAADSSKAVTRDLFHRSENMHTVRGPHTRHVMQRGDRVTWRGDDSEITAILEA